jgi:hypothetical protein
MRQQQQCNRHQLSTFHHHHSANHSSNSGVQDSASGKWASLSAIQAQESVHYHISNLHATINTAANHITTSGVRLCERNVGIVEHHNNTTKAHHTNQPRKTTATATTKGAGARGARGVARRWGQRPWELVGSRGAGACRAKRKQRQLQHNHRQLPPPTRDRKQTKKQRLCSSPSW